MAFDSSEIFSKRAGVLCVVLAATALSVAPGCGGGGGETSTTPVQTTPTVTTNAAVTASKLYATNALLSGVDVYAANQSGAVIVLATLSTGSAGVPEAIAIDAQGNLYVGVDTNTGGEVQVFPGGATKAAHTLTLPNPGSPNSNQVVTMTTDSSGNLYVAATSVVGTTGSSAIYVYAAGATGAATPTQTISGSATMLSTQGAGDGINQMAVDSSGELYVAQGASSPGAEVLMFAKGADGNPAPTVITDATYAPSGVAVDSHDNIYISQGSYGTNSAGATVKYPSAIYVFAKGAVAGATPTRAITGSATGMFLSLYNVQVDSAGNIFVEQNDAGHSQFLVYSATSNGDVAPSSALTPSRGTTTDSQFVLQ